MVDTFTSIENPRDWRGVPIKVDALVLYGASVGRSVALVEATVVGFTDSGRVTLRPVRRAYGSSATWGSSGTRKTVHVGQDRLTVVGVLPDSELPTEDEIAATAEMNNRARKIRYESHLLTVNDKGTPTVWTQKCERCGCSVSDAYRQECAS